MEENKPIINPNTMFEIRSQSFFAHAKSLNDDFKKFRKYNDIEDIRKGVNISDRPISEGKFTSELTFNKNYGLTDEIKGEIIRIYNLYFLDYKGLQYL